MKSLLKSLTNSIKPSSHSNSTSFKFISTTTHQSHAQNQSSISYGVTYVPPLKITRQHTKRADYGLYDGLKVKAGDNIPKSKHRTKRVWNPNVQKSSLWSEVLNQSLQLKVTTAALKMIDKVGGLDRYVLQMSDKRLGGTGIRIRELVIAAMKEKLKLSKGFTRPIPESELWKIPQWQDSIERSDRLIIRKMVPSIDVNEVKVFPRRLKLDGKLDQVSINDLFQRGQKGHQTSRRSTHPRR
ncbi:ribosomal L28 family-domain-containing protein [Melampsora americana]|nr:ribosomal L28 family-domain-containing protein [Melampsora americana]